LLNKAFLNGADLSNVQGHSIRLMWADLSGANLSKSDLNSSDLSNSTLDKAHLSNAQLTSCNFNQASLCGANLTGANLANSSFNGADFTNADLSRANLEPGRFQECNFQSSNLQLVNLSKVDLSTLNFTDANLERANLENANLRQATLKNVNLERANLRGANLINANLEGANLAKADLTGANIYGANLQNVDFTGTIMPNGERYKSEDNSPQLLDKPKTVSDREKTITRKIIKTENAPKPVGPYNQAVMVNNMIFLSGQIAIVPRLDDILYPDDITKQTERVMSNLEAVLTEAGATWENVVKTTIFLKDMNDFTQVNEVYSKYFKPETAPARATVEVSRLPKDVLVEIECTAII
jgi:2-iminobutanoate/2-iminopropanoate deaminase